MIRWDIPSTMKAAGGAQAVRNSDNLKLPSRAKAYKARKALEQENWRLFTTVNGEIVHLIPLSLEQQQ